MIDFIQTELTFKCDGVLHEFYSDYESDEGYAGAREYARDSADYDPKKHTY